MLVLSNCANAILFLSSKSSRAVSNVSVPLAKARTHLSLRDSGAYRWMSLGMSPAHSFAGRTHLWPANGKLPPHEDRRAKSLASPRAGVAGDIFNLELAECAQFRNGDLDAELIESTAAWRAGP